jgi:enoyl-CoA hydratase
MSSSHLDLKTIRYEVAETPEGHKIGTLQIARSAALNALNRQVMNDLKLLVHDLELKHELRALIVTGEGEKAFVAGADIKEMEHLNPSQARELSLHGQALLHKLGELPFPVIAAVNGFALGGGLELALACDFIIASNKAQWGLPEVTLGLIPGYGGTQRLLRQLGPALAKRVAMSGEMFSAQQGYEWGLFTQICEPTQLMTTAKKVAETLAKRAPLALRWVKEAISAGADKTLLEGSKIEAELFARTFETKDRSEGVKAFIEKRPASFQGH